MYVTKLWVIISEIVIDKTVTKFRITNLLSLTNRCLMWLLRWSGAVTSARNVPDNLNDQLRYRIYIEWFRIRL